ncbi:MAG: hypothetical protein HQL30_05995 [Candidatus Omnitrophica bacterium]|nr:hypothetical protein [Candidatus Omnitrophota bacterium]
MYRRCAVKFNKKQVEFVNCVNMVERVKKARALPSGISHLGVKRYVLTSSGGGENLHFTLKSCDRINLDKGKKK